MVPELWRWVPRKKFSEKFILMPVSFGLSASGSYSLVCYLDSLPMGVWTSEFSVLVIALLCRTFKMFTPWMARFPKILFMNISLLWCELICGRFIPCGDRSCCFFITTSWEEAGSSSSRKV